MEFPVLYENDSVINLGDKFTMEMQFLGESESEVDRFELVGPLDVELSIVLRFNLDEIDNFQKISYLSPLGMAVWGVSKEKGTEFRYRVGNNDVKCILL